MKKIIDFKKREVLNDLSHLTKKEKELLEIEADYIVHQFDNNVEMIASILPEEFFDTKKFKELEAEFLTLHLPEDAWLPIEVYARKNNITRQAVYHRRKLGWVEIKKFDGVSHARDVE